MNRNQLSPEDRAEYDEVFQTACFHENGDPVKAPDLGPRLLSALQAIESAWAGYLIDDATVTGLQTKGKAWQNQRVIHQTKRGERVVTRSNVARLRKVDAETGESSYQAKLWEDMTRDEVETQVNEANIRISSDRLRVRDGLRLLDLMDETETDVVREALHAKHITLTDYLTDQEKSA